MLNLKTLPWLGNQQHLPIPDLPQPKMTTTETNDDSYNNFFRDKTIFLTGATGNLGGCILYKLTEVLGCQHIYVLCRGSAARAKIKLTKNMPLQAPAILLHPGLVFITGDIKEPGFAIAQPLLERMQREVQIIINAAADISLQAPLSATMASNCMPPLELAQMATKFQHLESFIQISTAYCNSFLPDGIVEEKIYPLGDPEVELSAFSEKGTTQYLSQFPAPYYYSKVYKPHDVSDHANAYPDISI